MLQRNVPLPSDSIHDSGVGSPFTMFSRLTFCGAGGPARERLAGKPSQRPGARRRLDTRANCTRLVLEAGVVVRAPVSVLTVRWRHGVFARKSREKAEARAAARVRCPRLPAAQRHALSEAGERAKAVPAARGRAVG